MTTDDVKHGAAPQAVDDMGKEWFAAKLSQDLAGQTLRAETSLDNSADPHHTTARVVTRSARRRPLPRTAAEAVHGMRRTGVAGAETQREQSDLTPASHGQLNRGSFEQPW